MDIIGFNSKIIPQPNKGNHFITSPCGNYQQPELMNTIIFHWMLWNKAYHKNIIDQTNDFFDTYFHPLPKINMAEDVLKFFVLCLFAQNYLGINKTLHFYFKNDKSITRDLKNLKRHKLSILGFNYVIAMLKKIAILKPHIKNQAYTLIEILSNHRRETKYSYWSTRAINARNYIGNMQRAIKSTKSIKKKIIGYRKITLFLATLGLLKT